MAWPGTMMTSTTHANFIPELWTIETINAVEKNLVFANLVSRWDSLAKQGGDTIHIPNVTNFTAKDKATSNRVDPQATTEGKTDILLNKHKEVSYFVEDFAKIQANQDLRNTYTEKAGYAIAKAIDDDIAALYAGAGLSVSCGAAATYAYLREARRKLSVAEAPMNNRFLVANSYVIDDMLNIDEIKNKDFLNVAGQMPAESGQVSRSVLGFQVYESNNITTGVESTPLYHCMAFQKDAIALAVQLGPRVQYSYQHGWLSELITFDVIYGVKVLRSAFLCDFQRNV